MKFLCIILQIQHVSDIVLVFFFDLLHLVWLSLFSSMLLQMALFHSFLWLILHCIYPYQISFTHSSVDGHLGCFHILASIIVRLWTLGCMCLFELWFSLDICPGVGLLDYMVVLYFIFKGTSLLFSLVAAPVYIPTNSLVGFPFLHILSSICCS